MRLSLILQQWPKIRPRGNIWIGKDQMVLKVQDYHKPQLLKDVEREKKNMMYCMRPAVSVDKEEAFFKFQESISPNPEQVLTQMRQAKLEETTLKPMPLSTHYDSLAKVGGWEKL